MERVIGQSGDDFLIDVGMGAWEGHRTRLAFVFERRAARVHQPFPLDSLLSRGGWQEPTADLAVVLRDLHDVRALDDAVGA